MKSRSKHIARQSVVCVIKPLNTKVDTMQTSAEALIAATPTFAADATPLAFILRVGVLTITTVLAELPRFSHVPNAQEAAACFSPREFTSGCSVRGQTRLSKSVSAGLWKALELPTLHHGPYQLIFSKYFPQHISDGRPKCTVRAYMRKLILIRNGCLKNLKPFEAIFGVRVIT